MKRFSITTLGCKVNQYESQVVREDFLRRNFAETDNPQDADICIVNTCAVTSRAERKSRNIISRISRMNPAPQLYVMGCFAQEKGEEVLGLQNVAGILEKPKGGISFFENHTRAFVKIEDGCENFCAYCIVPVLRGKVRSRPLAQVREEVLRLIGNGYKEIVLSGICLGAYGRDMGFEDGLSLVLRDLEGIGGDFRIRLSSIEPMFVSEGTIEAMRHSNRICRHLHIPFQSGDDEILKRMNRRYSVADYEGLVEKLRKNFPDLSLTTDIIVGFPGEREENFANTIKFLKKILPLKVHLFPFSPRPNTAASRLRDRVPAKIVSERMAALNQLACQLSIQFRRKFQGQMLRILVESVRDKETGLLQGYTDNYIKVLFEGPDEQMNSFVWKRIDRIGASACLGKASQPALARLHSLPWQGFSACLGKEPEAQGPGNEVCQMRRQEGR